MQIETKKYEKQNSENLQATPKTSVTPPTLFSSPAKKSITDSFLDQKLHEFKGKKD